MPWDAAGAKKHNKSLTPEQAKKWASIANGVLKDCLKAGGSQKKCEGKAIRVANSKFENEEEGVMNETMKVPKGALCFMDHDGFATVKKDDDKDHLHMVVYSGGVIKNHWYWNSLAIDLSGLKFPSKNIPILESHMTDRKIAFTNNKPKTDSGAIIIDDANFVETEASQEFRKLSKDGFPYQASFWAQPSIIERILEGSKAEVNGFMLKGPATIWRECMFKEASVCVFGYDPNTKATAFANEEVELTLNTLVNAEPDEPREHSPREEVGTMNLDEFKEKYPELLKEIETGLTATVTTSLTEQFKAEKATMRQQFDQEKGQLSTKVLTLEKREAIRTEKELKATADSIWTMKLSASEIPVRLFDKVRGQVNHEKFVKDDALDTATFSAAVDTEIADWQEKLPDSVVLGIAFAEKSDVGDKIEERQKKNDEDLANVLFSFAGTGGEEVKT